MSFLKGGFNLSDQSSNLVEAASKRKKLDLKIKVSNLPTPKKSENERMAPKNTQYNG